MGRPTKGAQRAREKMFLEAYKATGSAVGAMRAIMPEGTSYNTLKKAGSRLLNRAVVAEVMLKNLVSKVSPSEAMGILKERMYSEDENISLRAVDMYCGLLGAKVNRVESKSESLSVRVDTTAEKIQEAIRRARDGRGEE